MGWSGMVFIQEVDQSYPVKILLDRGASFGRLRYWVGGWGNGSIDFTEIDTGAGFPTQLYSITATGPEPNDWIASGRVLDGFGTNQRFYNHTGLINEYAASPGGVDIWAAYAGHFVAGFRNQLNGSFFWTTPSASGTEGFSGLNQSHGFVLPSIRENGRVRTIGVAGRMRARIVPNLDLSYAVLFGADPVDNTFTGNPWIVSNAGTFTRLSTNLHLVIIQSDLIGTTLFSRNANIVGNGPWANPLTVTPHSINPTSGVVTSQNPRTVSYRLPSGRGGAIVDSSIWF